MRSVAVARARSCKFELQQHAPPFYPRLHAPRKNSRVFPAEMQLRNPRMGFLRGFLQLADGFFGKLNPVQGFLLPLLSVAASRLLETGCTLSSLEAQQV